MSSAWVCVHQMRISVHIFVCPLRAKCGPIVCVSCLFLFSCLPLLLSVPNSEMSRQPMGQLLGQPGKCCFFEVVKYSAATLKPNANYRQPNPQTLDGSPVTWIFSKHPLGNLII